ncbi:DgyrCDS3944 [Dimorphilus gyrociliatus]|uniref:DgyrCDS3944 n=1 Tax=Dimorphilus gyrociliatus TaxID=2664684 RepID=A0A7I8VI17_9ANNE|nr:DgyrCDS3944 [Dimorphilus gyrociliatus]
MFSTSIKAQALECFGKLLYSIIDQREDNSEIKVVNGKLLKLFDDMINRKINYLREARERCPRYSPDRRLKILRNTLGSHLVLTIDDPGEPQKKKPFYGPKRLSSSRERTISITSSDSSIYDIDDTDEEIEEIPIVK